MENLNEKEIRSDINEVKEKLLELERHYKNQIELFTEEIKFIDSMNEKLRIDLEKTPSDHFKKRSQLQTAYLRNIECKSTLQSNLGDYEKLLSVNLKEQRSLNNDKVKNIKTLEEDDNKGETNIVELFTQINELFRNKKELEERERQQGQLLPAEEMFLKVQTELKETGYIP
jgi:hypothetical protein